MYNENGFSVKNFILKVILVVLFVFLLMWLFPMPNLKPVYDRLFVENVETMKNVAKTYYTVERLPKEVGESVKLTLDEMLAMKLILPIADSNDKLCDGRNSFVEVMKTDTEYVIKTTLTCSNKSDYVIEHLGCYNLCADGCKVETPVVTPQPEVSKPKPTPKPTPVKTTMYELERTWYKGYTTNATAATTMYKHEKYATSSTFTGYSSYCPSGYSPDGSSCSKTQTVTEYYCTDSGATLSGSQCIIPYDLVKYVCASDQRVVASSTTVCSYKSTTTTKYYCGDKEVTKGTECTTTKTTYTYSCPSGYATSGSGSSTTCSKWVYAGTGYAASLPSSSSSTKYVATGTKDIKECNACVPRSVVTYEKYTLSTVSPTKTSHYNTVTTSPTTKQSTTSTPVYPVRTLVPSTKTVAASSRTKEVKEYKDYLSTANYSYYTYLVDSKWTYNSYESGYVMVDKKTISGTTTKVYTPDWVLSLPAGYTKTETKIEKKWSSSKTESGWHFNGNTKTVTK